MEAGIRVTERNTAVSAKPCGRTDVLFDLTGRRAIVTGAAGGIGRAAAAALARYGAEVLLVDNREDELLQTHHELRHAKTPATPLVADLCMPEDIEHVAEVAARRGGADIVVNIAGVMRRGNALDATVEDLDFLWRVNTRALFAMTQALLPQLVAKGRGKVINVGSLGSVIGLERRTAYAVTKGAVRQYTQSLAAELGEHNVCVNAIAPGYIDTDMSAEWLHGDHARNARLLGRIPLQRFGRGRDLEGAFVFLAAAASDYMTGQVLVIDGGWTSW
jgi:NAD(P)-dependent dehydrogenase (short-subunit alcohol dehydrogenase family)